MRTSPSRSEEGVEEGRASGGGLLGLLGSLGLDALLLEDLLPAEGLGVGVETEENGLVDKGVLLLGPGALLDLLAGRADDGLDLIGVNDAGDVGVEDLGGGEEVVLLVDGSLVEGAEDIIEEGEGTLGPDDETAEVSSGSELEEVEAADVDELNTGKVAEGLDDTVVLVVDNEGATALAVATVPELALSSTDLAGVGDLDNIGVGLQGLEEGDSLLGLGESLDLGSDNEGNLLDLLDAVATSENEGRQSRSSESGDDGESALVLVDLDVPLAPGLGGGEHATTPAHVTEGSLAGTVSSSTTNTGNTGDSATSSPRLSGGLVTSLLAHSVRLALVFGDALVDLLDDIETDGGGEDRGEREGGGGLSGGGANVDGGS